MLRFTECAMNTKSYDNFNVLPVSCVKITFNALIQIIFTIALKLNKNISLSRLYYSVCFGKFWKVMEIKNAFF